MDDSPIADADPPNTVFVSVRAPVPTPHTPDGLGNYSNPDNWLFGEVESVSEITGGFWSLWVRLFG